MASEARWLWMALAGVALRGQQPRGLGRIEAQGKLLIGAHHGLHRLRGNPR